MLNLLLVAAVMSIGMLVFAPVWAQQRQANNGPAAERFAHMLRILEERKRKDPDAHRKSNYELLNVKVEDCTRPKKRVSRMHSKFPIRCLRTAVTAKT